MRVTHFMLLVVVVVLLVLGRPETKFNKTIAQQERQEEEAQPEDGPLVLGEETIFPVTVETKNLREEDVADILWLKKAAQVALKNGTPYFNIIEQKFSKRFDREQNSRLSVIEGLIELDNDPIGAEYDAHEIESMGWPDDS